MNAEELNKFEYLNKLVSKLRSQQQPKVKKVRLSPDIKPNGYSVDANVLLDVAVIVLTGVCHSKISLFFNTLVRNVAIRGVQQ